jgi:hypothetical protein
MVGGEDRGECPYDGGGGALMMTNRHLGERRQTSSLAWHCHHSGELLPCAVDCLGSLLHHDADLHPLIGSGLLFCMR